jgi:hypothetical protein
VSSNTSREKEPQGTSSYSTGTDQDGRWKLASVTPGIPLKAELTGRNGPVLAAVDIAPLGRAEHRIVELELNRRPQTLRVQVLDPDRLPVPRAELRLEDLLQGYVLGRETDASGRCEFPSLYADRFTLTVQVADCPPTSVFTAAIPAESSSSLERRALSIELRNPTGRR